MSTIEQPATTDGLELPPDTTIPYGQVLEGLPAFTKLFERIRGADGPVATIRLGPEAMAPPIAVVTSPTGAADVLSATADGWDKGGPVIEEVESGVGVSSFTMQQEDWLPRRRTIQPVMTRRHVQGFASHMTGAADRRVEAWGTGTVDVVGETRSLALDVLGRSLFAKDLAARRDVITPAMDRTLRRVMRRGNLPFRLPDVARTRSSRKDVEVLRNLCTEALVAASANRARAADHATGAEFVDLLLGATDPETGEGLDREGIIGELMTFLVAGHDTTATTMAATLWALARHPELQDRVRAEVEAVDGPLEDGLGQLPFTRQCVQESLRLWPPGAGAGRLALRDQVVDGFRVPEGWAAIVSFWAIHRDPALWEFPLDYDPDRFEPARHRQRDRWQYLPFGGGSRSCVGEHFAMMEAVLAVARVVQRVRLSTEVERLEVDNPFTLVLVGPVPVQVEPLG